MTAKRSITVARLREVLDYDPETGIFRWKIRTSFRVRVGAIAGSVKKDHGYVNFSVDGVEIFGHRAAWAYMTGEWPINQIDHINRDRSDNRFVNLREATRSQNMKNVAAHRDNKSGRKGVSWARHAKAWKVQISVNGKNVWIGYFKDIEAAAAAYESAARKHFGQFAYTP